MIKINKFIMHKICIFYVLSCDQYILYEKDIKKNGS